MFCPSCSTQVPPGAVFCPSCATRLPGVESETHPDAPTELATGDPPGDQHTPPGSSASAVARGGSEGSRFLPGTVIADRYRLVGVLGRGGMGEVYRADDLKLGQPVALKFLPPAAEGLDEWLAQFLNEVKLARQISNPNVCRVYDVAEIDGQHFLSMEYIDGEDLASLLRRIGRLPHDKAVQTARQICAGLAAAHEQGILHRDLKPANVMIDGRGNARLTDFGLAGLAAGMTGADAVAGTPAYMAPEQLLGREVTVKSDLYSLGLVLYQLFTGEMPFDASSREELSRLQLESSPTSPSALVERMDPTVERIILRCLEANPADRPLSALAVAAALPGGDPLAAALAAGETPSPELVAAAGEEGTLSPRTAVLLLAGFVALTAVFVVLSGLYSLPSRAALELPRDVLIHRARDLLTDFGAAPEAAADWSWGLSTDADALRYLEEGWDGESDRWEALAVARPATIRFWYRQSPRPLLALRNNPNSVSWGEPPLVRSGMTSIRLDTRGRLLDYQRLPPQLDESEDAGVADTDAAWSALFAAAELDREAFVPAEPSWVPPMFADARAAWTGSDPDLPRVELRLEMAAFRGEPIYFRLVGPWSRAERQQVFRPSFLGRVSQVIGMALLILVLVSSLWITRRNLRAGRGDRRGAMRVAVFFLLVHLAVWVALGHHVSLVGAEFGLFVTAAAMGLFFALIAWLLYMALEPYARRHYPHWLVGWSRMLTGKLRDPLVGRDILIGALVGAFIAAQQLLTIGLERWIGRAPALPHIPFVLPMMGPRFAVGRFLLDLPNAVFAAMLFAFLWVLFLRLLRSKWLAGGLLVVFLTLSFSGQGDFSYLALLSAGLVAILFVGSMIRYGLLTLVSGLVFGVGLSNLPITPDPSAWWSRPSWINLTILAALAIWSFRTALGGRKAWAGSLLDDG